MRSTYGNNPGTLGVWLSVVNDCPPHHRSPVVRPAATVLLNRENPLTGLLPLGYSAKLRRSEETGHVCLVRSLFGLVGLRAVLCVLCTLVAATAAERVLTRVE